MFTPIITTELTLVAVAVAGRFVAVGIGDAVALGIDVPVAVGTNRVGVWVPVGEAVRVGNAVGTKDVRVGNGANVGKSKSNKRVGVACVPSVGKTLGLGRTFEELREGNKLIRIEQRQQNASSNRAGLRTLTICPCWLYVVFSAEMNELICFTIFFSRSSPVRLYEPNFTLPFAILAASIIQGHDWKIHAGR